jgi:hypothetical protein
MHNRWNAQPRFLCQILLDFIGDGCGFGGSQAAGTAHTRNLPDAQPHYFGCFGWIKLHVGQQLVNPGAAQLGHFFFQGHAVEEVSDTAVNRLRWITINAPA